MVSFLIRGVLAGWLLCTLGCNAPDNSSGGESGSVHAGATDTIVTGARAVPLAGCYQMILKRDTALLKLNIKDSTVTGTLSYHWYEKDWNEGTLKGVLREDRIIAEYTFQSEGMVSVREVIFRVAADGSLVEGFGDLEEKGGRIVFADSQTLQYQTNHPFLPVPCINR